MTGRGTTLVATVAAGLALASGQAAAQRWQVDVSGSSVRYDTASQITSASFSPLIEWNRPKLHATLSGALAAFQAGQWTTQGHGDVSYLFAPVPSVHALRTELVGALDGSVHTGGYRTAGTRGEFRLHFAGRAAGLWLGAAATTGWTTSDTGVATAVGPTAGVWARHGLWNATATWTPFRLEGAWYQQAEAHVSTTAGPVELLGYLGWRGAPAGSGVPNATWGGATATYWFSRQAALVAAAGTYASDLLQALPKGRYLSIGIRLSRNRPTVWAGSSAPHALYAPANGQAVLHFDVSNASTVAIVGDWTQWQPVPLTHEPDGRWLFRAHLPSGVHRFNLLVNGRQWTVPKGVTAVDDGFGGKIGLLVVP